MIAGVIVTLLTILGKAGIAAAAVILLTFSAVYVINIIKERRKITRGRS